MKVNKISSTKNANGISGYDFSCRTHFETLDCGSQGIAVRLQSVGGQRRYMKVTGTTNHFGAYEVARKLAPAERRERRARMAAAVSSGNLVASVAAMFQVTTVTVRNAMKEHGVPG